MDDIKRVIAADDIVFEEAGVTIPKGSIFIIDEVFPQGIVLITESGERCMIDLETFEEGFEIYIGE